MTETPTQPAEDQVPAGPEPEQMMCTFCGTLSSEKHLAGEDWQCQSCERYQDSAICPTCHQIARKSLMEGNS